MQAEIISSTYNQLDSSQIIVAVQFTDPNGNTFNISYNFGIDIDSDSILDQIQNDINNFNAGFNLSSSVLPDVQTSITANNISAVSINSSVLPVSPAMPADPMQSV